MHGDKLKLCHGNTPQSWLQYQGDRDRSHETRAESSESSSLEQQPHQVGNEANLKTEKRQQSRKSPLKRRVSWTDEHGGELENFDCFAENNEDSTKIRRLRHVKKETRRVQAASRRSRSGTSGDPALCSHLAAKEHASTSARQYGYRRRLEGTVQGPVATLPSVATWQRRNTRVLQPDSKGRGGG